MEEEKNIAEEPVQSKRDMFHNRLKSKYPEGEYADDEALFSQANDDYDDYEKTISDKDAELDGYKDRESKLVDVFNKNPEASQFLIDMARGENPWVSMIKRVGSDKLKEMLESEDNAEEFAKANQEWLERMAKNKELDEKAEVNLMETGKLIDSMIESGECTAEEMDDAIKWLQQVFQDAIEGTFRRESIEMALKANKYDRDVESARMDGEVTGRNAKITEELRKADAGDGVSHLNGKNGFGSPQPQDDMGALGRFDFSGSSIWERGGAKRTKR